MTIKLDKIGLKSDLEKLFNDTCSKLDMLIRAKYKYYSGSIEFNFKDDEGNPIFISIDTPLMRIRQQALHIDIDYKDSLPREIRDEDNGN